MIIDFILYLQVEINYYSSPQALSVNHFNIISKMGLEEEIEEQKKKRAAAKGTFTRKTNAFTTAHSDEAPLLYWTVFIVKWS